MLGKYKAENLSNAQGHPTGGHAEGVGIKIKWQNGPLGRGKDRKEPNGAFVETVIDIARQRLEFYQESEFRCEANAVAIMHLKAALDVLDRRTKEREAREVEGTHQK